MYVLGYDGDAALPPLVSNQILRVLRNQRYHLVGSHSAVKRCRWLYEALVHDRVCYKQRFYGIKSHQCIQMTPTALYCTMRCRFCWRVQSGDLELRWGEMELPAWDDPEEIVEGCIKAQLKILSGYKGNPKADPEKYREALTPRHAAISLTGEPTLYSPLGSLIERFHRRGFTTFLVSNGTVPEALSRLDEEPTQLYISVCAPNKSIFLKTCRPHILNAWEKLNETLKLLPSFSCRTVIRITLVRGFNMNHVEEYAKLIRKASPDFVEPKAFMHVGFSRFRLDYHNMPKHSEIRSFGSMLADALGYNYVDESVASRVVLLSRFKEKRYIQAS